jgi:heme-degrading monooxygenase HmoA
MFTRIVEVTAKTGKAKELSRTIDNKVISILRGQPGFVDEIVLVSQDNPDRVLALSFWKTRQDAETYGRDTFSRVNEVIGNLITDTPKVQTFDVTTSTVHDIATGRAA